MIDEIDLLDEIEIEDAPVYPLEQTELETLTRCEVVIARGVQTFIEVGEALAIIRDGKLYRADFTTFEHYCRNKWGIGDSRARQLIGASRVAREIETVTNVTLPNEGQARAIAKSAPADRPRVLDRATELAGDKPRTAKHIEQARAEIARPDLPLEFAVAQRRYASRGHVLSAAWDGEVQRFVVRKEGGTGVVMTWPDVLSKLERLETEPDEATELEIKRLCAICGAHYIRMPTDLPYPTATRYRIAFADHGGGGDYLAEEAFAKLRAACAAKEAAANPPSPSPRPASATVSAYDQQEQADIKLMRAAHDAIERGDYAGARAMLDQVQLATYERDQVARTLVRTEAQRFCADLSERLTRFSKDAMVSQTTCKQLLAHTMALIEITT